MLQGTAKEGLTTKESQRTVKMQQVLRLICEKKKILIDEVKMRQPTAYADQLHEDQKITDDDKAEFYKAVNQRRFSLSASTNPEPYDV